VTLVAALATQAAWPQAPRWTWVAAWLGASVLALLSSILQSVLGEAFVYGLGDAGRAAEEAPLALFGVLWAGALTLATRRRVAWWPGVAATVALLLLYVWASSWGWGGDGKGAALFGGAALNGAIVVVFTGAGWATAVATRSRNQG
jgi:hypothetical protein